MKKSTLNWFFIYIFLICTSIQACKTAQKAQKSVITTPPPTATNKKDDLKIVVDLFQINDVYEIAPQNNGTTGGMTKVATVIKNLKKQNPNTYALLAGDFLNPSVYATIKKNGVAIRGKQMVEAMNAAGINLVTFGNHEFDLKEAELQHCIDASKFEWVSGNVLHKTANGNKPEPFVRNEPVSMPLPQTKILSFTDADGTRLRIGVIAVTLNDNQPPYVTYTDPLLHAQEAYDNLKNVTDFVIAVTHQNMAEDKELARRLPQLKLILGGHEHHNQYERIGTTYIAKADANAHTAYIHTLKYNRTTKSLNVESTLTNIDATVPEDPEVKKLVDTWQNYAYTYMDSLGFKPANVVYTATTPIDATDKILRQRAMPFGNMLASALLQATPKADAAILNAGTCRLDDVIQGNYTEYDVYRTLPFGGTIADVEMKGSLLLKLLQVGTTKNIGTGGFLQLAGITTERDGKFYIKNQPINPEATYRIALTEYLMTGREHNLDFLTPDNAEIVKYHNPPPANANKNDLRNDIKKAFVAYLKTLK